MRLHTFYLRFCGAVVGLYVLLFLSTALAGGLKGIAAAFLSPFAVFFDNGSLGGIWSSRSARTILGLILIALVVAACRKACPTSIRVIGGFCLLYYLYINALMITSAV